MSYRYPHTTGNVLQAINLSFEKEDTVAIVGPSGCGKSTLLKLMAGLLKPTKGKIIAEKGLQVGLAPQSPTLLPWLDVTHNVTFTEKLGKKHKIKKTEVLGLLDRFGISDKAHSKPSELSGGQQTRVSLARALVGHPEILFLDEPFSMLDEVTAEAIMLDLRVLLEQSKPTTFFVSHNIAQAAFLADRIVVIAGAPSEIRGIVKVRLPKSRNIKAISSTEHNNATNSVRKLLKENKK